MSRWQGGQPKGKLNPMKKPLTYSLLSGILLGLANNELFGIPMAPLAWVALVPVLLALRNAKGFLSYFLTGYVFSLVYLLIAMFSFLTAYFAGGAVLIAVGALHFSLPFVVSYSLQKKVGWKRSLFVLPLLWPVDRAPSATPWQAEIDEDERVARIVEERRVQGIKGAKGLSKRADRHAATLPCLGSPCNPEPGFAGCRAHAACPSTAPLGCAGWLSLA
jgi:hypothetical protein